MTADMETTKIGTVEILRARVYPLVPGTEGGQDVFVEPGTYDLFREGDEVFWLMRGRKSRRIQPRFEKIGDGMFSMSGGGDVQSGREIEFSSPRFGPEAWADLLAEPNWTEGHPEQRLRVTLATVAAGE